MRIRGPIVDVGEPRTVGGGTDLVEVTVRPERGAADPVQVTLWNKWNETADYAEEGMELLVTDAEESEFRGEVGYETTPDSWVVLEPDFLVDVTAVRSWVQCPRMYYLNKLSGVPLKYPVVKGTVVHEVFGDLLRGRDLEDAIEHRVEEAGLELGALGYDREEVEDEVRRNAAAVEGWLSQGTLTEEDTWRSEYTLISPTFGIKGRADALRRGMPVELKTGKNTKREPRFQDKMQAACYALMLEEQGVDVEGRSPSGSQTQSGNADTGTLLYTKNTALERAEETGDLSPAKEFSVGPGLLKFVVRTRNELAAMEYDASVPTGFEADAKCQYCFEQDTCMVVSGRLDQESKAGQIGQPLPAEERAYFEGFYQAIEAERRAVHAEYRKLWEQGAEERDDDDRALLGLEPLDREELPGGRWRLRASKPDDAVSKLREGDVALASDGDPVSGHAELCRIQSLGTGKAGAEIVVEADEPVDVRRLDVYPSELSIDRMLTALHDGVLKGDPDRKDVLFGRREPEFSGEEREYVDNNDAQNEAVNLATRAEDFALVHGPPGTGKTYTIAQTVQALIEQGERVLLSAFTNRAVDNALEAVREQGIAEEEIVRVGTESGIREDMQDLRLEQAGDPGERIAELREASLMAATTASCGSRIMREESFDVALVDEASQLTEPATLAAINLADRFVLVGDHEQLPPVVQVEGGERWSSEYGLAEADGGTTTGEQGVDGASDARPARLDLSTSLFERLHELAPEASVLLDRQYRMAQRIQAFSSTEFYDGALRPANREVAAQRISDLPGVDADSLPADLRDPVAFVDPDGAQTGNTNPTEADRVAEIVDEFIDAGVDAGEIGVIAPFRAQVAEISRRVDVTVDTVDRFQGSSEEVIIVSFVATGALSGPIYDDPRRMNVALTRAKKSLVLVGDADALGADPFYGRMLEWANR